MVRGLFGEPSLPVEVPNEDADIEIVRCHAEGQPCAFVLNHRSRPEELRLRARLREELTGAELSGPVTLAAYEVMFLREAHPENSTETV